MQFINTTKCSHQMNQWQSESVTGSLTKVSRVNGNLRSAWITAYVHFLPKISLYFWSFKTIAQWPGLYEDTYKWLRTENMKLLVAQLCLTLWDPMDCSPPASSVHGILQARILEWVAMPFSRASSQGSSLQPESRRDSVSCIGSWVLY